MTIFLALPHVRIAGKPAILLDLPRREFTLFGTTFLPTDTLLLMLLAISTVIAVFLASALAGRVWCGWPCRLASHALVHRGDEVAVRQCVC